MKSIIFAERNQKEILRDPVSIIFFIGVPVVILIIFSIMNQNVPYELYKIENLTPGIAVFSFAFISLFSGMLIAKDRTSSFLSRLFASPLESKDYIVGYSLPLLVVAIIQTTACFVTGFFFGLEIRMSVLWAIVGLIPTAIMFIGLGLLLGSFFK